MKIIDSPSLRSLGNRQLRFYLTNASPCPYLDGQIERKVFTNLATHDAEHLHDALTQSGFRRSQNIAYRPACPGCNACKATRLPVADFTRSKRWRRVWNKNSSLMRFPRRPVATREQFRLLKTYLDARHENGGMTQMDLRDYVAMVEGSPIPSVIFEYREGDDIDSPLIAVAIADVLRDGLSMVYSFFDPAWTKNGLGNFIILDHIEHARQLGLDYVYMGYWVHGSQKMGYKSDFRPLEVLDGEEWTAIEELEKKIGMGTTE